MTNPLVSVIIPCYNHGQYLRECIASVKAQTYPAIEIVLVNDGSTDAETNRIISAISDPQVKIVNKENGGLASARNAGIEQAAGELILPLDADDRIGEAYIQLAAEAILKDASAGIVYCRGRYFGTEEKDMDSAYESLHSEMLYNGIFCTAMFRKANFLQAGRYNTNMRHGYEDWDLWLRIIPYKSKVIQLPGTMFFYRQHTNSMLKDLGADREKMNSMENTVFINNLPLYLKEYGSMIGALRLLDQLKNDKETADSARAAVHKTASYRLGNMILSPLKLIKKLAAK